MHKNSSKVMEIELIGAFQYFINYYSLLKMN